MHLNNKVALTLVLLLAENKTKWQIISIVYPDSWKAYKRL